MNENPYQSPLAVEVLRTLCGGAKPAARTLDVACRAGQGKHASAHDLRRSFGTRWARRLKPATLQLLMRHRSIETTMKYYVDLDADDIADELWQEYKPSETPKKQGDQAILGLR